MNHANDSAEVEGFISRLTVVWSVMFGAIGVFVIVTWVFISTQTPLINVNPGLVSSLTSIFIGVAVADVAIMFYLDRKFKSEAVVDAFLNSRKNLTEKEDGAIIEGDTSAHHSVTRALLPHYIQLCVIRWALAEALGVYGLMLSFVTANMILPAVFYIAAVGLMAVMKPKLGELDEIASHAGNFQ